MNNEDLKEDIVDTNQQPAEEIKQPVEEEACAPESVAEEAAANAETEAPVEEVAANAETEAPAEEAAAESDEPIVETAEEESKPSEAEIYRDRLIRLQADFDNYRKRMARDRADMIKSANADLLLAMLPALDHIDHALASLEKTAAAPVDADGNEKSAEPNPYIEGFKLIQNELLRGLDKFGLSPIESIGKPFDVEVHEALSKMPSDSMPAEHVLFEVRKGYMLNGKVLRAAQVIVSAPVE